MLTHNNPTIAFLRGINVGGNTTVPMAALKEVLTGLGCRDVKTVLNSGNAVFQAEETDRSALTRQIQAVLREAFGFEVAVMLRSGEEIRALLDADPFKDVTVTPETRLYVTFLGEGVESRTKAPFVSPQGDYGVVRVFPREVCTFIILSKDRGTPELMKGIEEEYGRQITTRSWNTIVRIGKLLG
jgi:uncharacterized protein (DUF1697 family)